MPGKRKSAVFKKFKDSPGFNTKRTLGNHNSLPKPPAAVVQEVYSFQEPDNESNLVIETINNKPQIKAGTIEKLVERLTHETQLGEYFV